ncbi:sialidase family protein [Actinoallomurus rhizosphaericola]|uniref:sialidase family protein n=1 Tax=Actinoallomurus rhizosphaericola TaxID=2952536 RepID=UPI0020938608|nr:sialidase family protein [Actinoallomurus rhizosphaericola]MCO5999521.1 glycoside hydrolase [Actinoallomurus rhizosphaericola]
MSGKSPTPGTTAGQGPASSVNYPGAEVEPWIAVNPQDHGNIIGFYQQDRWNNGGAHTLTFSVTHDHGRHWKQVVLPGVSKAAGGPYDRVSDPGVSFAPNGDAYAISLPISWAPDNSDTTTSAIGVSKSTDGGDTWSKPIFIQQDTDGNYFNDKELITADPTSSKRVYAVWDRSNPQGGQPIFFSRTTDGGRTWEKPHAIYDPTADGTWTIANQIVVQPDGTLVDMFFEGSGDSDEGPDGIAAGSHDPDARRARLSRLAETEPSRIRVIRSTDHGKTWSKPSTVADVDPSEIVDPDQHQPLRTGDVVPDIAVDHKTGRLYVAWQDASVTESGSAILLSSSANGRTWTEPIKVSKTPDSAAQGNGQAFTPVVDVADDGTVGVTYYDFRRNTPAPGALTDFWIVTSPRRAAGDPRAWHEQHVGGSFDVTLAAVARGYFLGDYTGLDHAGGTFTALFTQTHPIPDNQQDEYFATIHP